MKAVQAALDELMGEIQVRQEAVEALRRLYPLGQVLPDHGLKAERVAARQKPRPTVKKPKGVTASPSRGAVLLRIAGLVEGLAEPFTAPAVGAAAKLNWKHASNFITQAKLKGWVKRVGAGKYVRTSKYPILVVAARPEPGEKPVTVLPPPGRAKAQVERELAEALKDRDAQRAAGRTTMEGIAQRKVDALEEELELLP